MTLRSLFVLANPTDSTRYDDQALWSEIQESVAPLLRRGSVSIERCLPATEIELRQRLARGDVQLLHIVAHGHERAPVRYAALALEGSDGRTRNVVTSALGSLLATSPGLRVVVLQAPPVGQAAFQLLAASLVERGLTVLVAPPLAGRAQRLLVSKVASCLLAGSSADGIRAELAYALSRDSSVPVVVLAKDGASPVLGPEVATAPAPVSNSARPIPHEHAVRELAQKRAAGVFDVFLCHNSADKPAVLRVAEGLKSRGLLPWLDVWELPPGQAWQPLLEQQLGGIRAAAVFIGAAGLGPWQEQEVHALLRELVTRKIPVIPILLVDAPHRPELPRFLGGITYIDLRSPAGDPLDLVVWGVTGKRPDDAANVW